MSLLGWWRWVWLFSAIAVLGKHCHDTALLLAVSSFMAMFSTYMAFSYKLGFSVSPLARRLALLVVRLLLLLLLLLWALLGSSL